VLKGAEAESKSLKDELKNRGLLMVAGNSFTVTRSEQISGRLDVSAVKQYLGDSWRRFEVATISTVIRIKATKQVEARLSRYDSPLITSNMSYARF